MNTDETVANLTRALIAKRKGQGVTAPLSVEGDVMDWLVKASDGPGLALDAACIVVEAHPLRLNEKATPEEIGRMMLVDFDGDTFAVWGRKQ